MSVLGDISETLPEQPDVAPSDLREFPAFRQSYEGQNSGPREIIQVAAANTTQDVKIWPIFICLRSGARTEKNTYLL
jgi:hypothetical protein